MNAKRIALLGTRGIPARYGGFETFAEELAVRLASRGYDVAVYCEAVGGGSNGDVYKGVRLVHMDAPALGPLSTIVFDVKCLWHARRGFDIVYMLGYGASPFCFLPRLWKSDVWINMDGLEWARSKWSSVARLWLRLSESVALWTANRLIADAEAIRKSLTDRYRRRPGISVVAYGADVVENAPDPALIEEWRLEPGGYYLVVCRLEPENHVSEIIDGYAQTSSEFPLIIVGDRDLKTEYVDSLLKKADSRVRFVGTIFDKPVLQALRWHCRAYCHGHSVGGTNPSLLEALGCGNRIIAHDNPFNREVAATCAEYFGDAGQVRKIVNKFDTVAPDAELRKHRYARVRKYYDWETITAQYVRLIERSE